MDHTATYISQVITAEVLRKTTGYKQSAALEKYLERQGIPYFPGIDGPWTTLELLNQAGMAKIGGTLPNSTETIDIP